MERDKLIAICWNFCGFAVGVMFVLLSGILTIQMAADRDGAVVSLNNVVVAVEAPSTPFLQWVAGALLGALMVYGFTLGLRNRPALVQMAAPMGVALSGLAMFAWSLVLDGGAPRNSPAAATLLGWRGWLQEGGTNPAVHLVIVLMLGRSVLAFMSREKLQDRA